MKSSFNIPEDGFCGRFFQGDAYPDSAVIVIPGTGTAEENAVKAFGYINRAGFSVLILAHSIWRDMPADPIGVPVEYVGRAMAALELGGYHNIAVFGLSFGARYALLAATVYPQIQTVIAASPYDYVSEAVKGMLKPLNRSVHSLNGEDLPCLPIEVLHKCLPIELLKLLFDREYGIHNMMRYGYNSCTEREEARIPVEKIRADVLLMAPAWDTCWPSERAVPRMEDILLKNNPEGEIKSIIYPEGNHILAIDLDAIPDRKKKMQSFMKERPGGEASRQESIQETLRFLHRWAQKQSEK